MININLTPEKKIQLEKILIRVAKRGDKKFFSPLYIALLDITTGDDFEHLVNLAQQNYDGRPINNPAREIQEEFRRLRGYSY